MAVDRRSAYAGCVDRMVRPQLLGGFDARRHESDARTATATAAHRARHRVVSRGCRALAVRQLHVRSRRGGLAPADAGAGVVTPEPTAYDVLHVRADAHHEVIKAAYRALARLSHPDLHRQPAADQRMAALNRAYDQVGSPERRAAYDAQLAHRADPPPANASESAREPMRPPPDTSGSASLDFGRYAGWSIAQLARHDPDYLRWLSRHSSGIRYRREIHDELQSSGVGAAGRRMTAFSPFRARRSVAAT